MSDQHVIERIDAWLAVGLIDEATADRLRAAEASHEAQSEQLDRPGRGTRSAISSLFGPSVSIGEVFAYVGAGFLLAAWHTLYSSLFASVGDTPPSSSNSAVLAVQFAAPAVAFAVIGWFAARRGDRERRLAGVAFAVATVHVPVAVIVAFQPGISEWQVLAVAAAGSAAAVAALFRRFYPAVLTQLGLLGSLAGLSVSLLGWLDAHLYPTSAAGDFGPEPTPLDGGAALIRAVLTLAWWIGWAVAFGLLARLEARQSANDGTAERERINAGTRAEFTRFVAGIVAVAGTISAVGQSNGFERVLPTWLGDLGILAVSSVLIVIAFRRGTTSYLYPAAIGVIGAFTDLNATYIAERTGIGVALLVEGVILIGAGLLADRLRRRLLGPGNVAGIEPAASPGPATAAPAGAPDPSPPA